MEDWPAENQKNGNLDTTKDKVELGTPSNILQLEDG